MNPTDPDPVLSADEKAVADALRSRVRPAAAPEDFARSLGETGPSAEVAGKVVPLRTGRFRRLGLGVAAAAAVALVWIAIHFSGSGPDQPSIAGPAPGSDAAKNSDHFPAPPPEQAAGDAAEPLLAVREIAVVRRDNGRPPIQLLAVEAMRVIPGRGNRTLEVESRLVPVVLQYH